MRGIFLTSEPEEWDDREEDSFCPDCGAEMDLDHDVDEDMNGRRYVSGVSWSCKNPECKS
jgi:hypothetical protein